MRSFFAVCRRYFLSIFPSTSHPHYNVYNCVNRNSFYNVKDAGDFNN